ncbi:unnamed protein product [Candida verbasci]|uniref:mitogen-activated protein kinase kinase n=1 Tax=Candida verbasci TaxID=1227364 RepID=A0A9W4TWA7_9ASCO|nr:unnamed protein product [Candida verbasci]
MTDDKIDIESLTINEKKIESHAHASQLNSDIQARLLAFQKQRSKPNQQQQLQQQQQQQQQQSPPIAKNVQFNSDSNIEIVNLEKEKPLPPLPSLNNNQPPIQHKPFSSPKIEVQKKPSLSQRRGMKLNMNDMPKDPILSPDSEKKHTPGELSRRLSERKKKPNFKLNLDSGGISRSNSLKDNLSRSSSLSSTEDTDSPETDSLQGLFANYSKYIDIKSGQLNFAGKASLHSKGVDFSSGSSFRVSLDEFEYLEELGRGNYGSVSKVLHKPTNVLMAMKEVRLELDETKFTQILMELEILHKCDSPYIVDFYGAFFVEGAVYMCIEYMDGGSLDKIFGNNIGIKDEQSLAYITESVTRGLKELKDQHNIIHRDVKPTNILVNTQGKVKLCDFGVSGNLVASLAKTNIGCQSYMAPERIKTLNPNDATYSVQSDVWSLGLTILELAVGHYPYPPETYDNIFSQLSAIVDGDPPKLDPMIYSLEAHEFVNRCLNKDPDARPSYSELLESPWLKLYGKDQHLDKLVQKRLKEIDDEKNVKKKIANLPTRNVDSVQSLLRGRVKAPALHRGGLQQANKKFLNNK